MVRNYSLSGGIKLIETVIVTQSDKLNSLPSGKHVHVKYTPIEPHFYIAKLGFVGVYLFFLFLLQNIDCGYSLEPPRRGGSNVYPQSMFGAKIKNKYQTFSAENFQFLKLKKSLFIAWASFHNDNSNTPRLYSQW